MISCGCSLTQNINNFTYLGFMSNNFKSFTILAPDVNSSNDIVTSPIVTIPLKDSTSHDQFYCFSTPLHIGTPLDTVDNTVFFLLLDSNCKKFSLGIASFKYKVADGTSITNSDSFYTQSLDFPLNSNTLPLPVKYIPGARQCDMTAGRKVSSANIQNPDPEMGCILLGTTSGSFAIYTRTPNTDSGQYSDIFSTGLPTDTTADYILNMYDDYKGQKNIPTAFLSDEFKTNDWEYSDPAIGFDVIYIACNSKSKDTSLIWVLDFNLEITYCIKCTFQISNIKTDNYGRLHIQDIYCMKMYSIDIEAHKVGDESYGKTQNPNPSTSSGGNSRYQRSAADYSTIKGGDWLYQGINLEDFFNEGSNTGGIYKDVQTGTPDRTQFVNMTVIDDVVTYLRYIPGPSGPPGRVQMVANKYFGNKDSRRPCSDAFSSGNSYYYPFVGV